MKLEFSPVYWLSNGSLVPSTLSERENNSPDSTFDSSSTSSASTEATSTFNVPAVSDNELPPPVVQVQDVSPVLSGPDSLENSLLNAPVSNEIMVEQPENLSENHGKPLLASVGMIESSMSGAEALLSEALWMLLLATTVLGLRSSLLVVL